MSKKKKEQEIFKCGTCGLNEVNKENADCFVCEFKKENRENNRVMANA